MDREEILLMLKKINGESQNLSFFHPGSNLTMITHTAAWKFSLKGTDVCLTKIGNQNKKGNASIQSCFNEWEREGVVGWYT